MPAHLLLPRLRQLESDLTSHPEARNLKPKVETLRAIIKAIGESTESVELRELD